MWTCMSTLLLSVQLLVCCGVQLLSIMLYTGFCYREVYQCFVKLAKRYYFSCQNVYLCQVLAVYLNHKHMAFVCLAFVCLFVNTLQVNITHLLQHISKKYNFISYSYYLLTLILKFIVIENKFYTLNQHMNAVFNYSYIFQHLNLRKKSYVIPVNFAVLITVLLQHYK